METIGLDFGTSTTYLSRSLSQLSTAIPLGRLGYIPSIAVLKEGHKLLVGEDVDADDPNVIRSIKTRITNMTEGVDWDSPISNASSTSASRPSEIIREIISQAWLASGVDYSEKLRVKLGCPSSWNGEQRMALLEIARTAGVNVSSVNLVDEPVAAVSAWFFAAKQAGLIGGKGKQTGILRIALLDMGGGTLDVALVDIEKFNELDPEIRVLASLGNALAGDAFDSELARVVSADAAKAKDPVSAVAKEFPTAFLAACKTLKHAIGSKAEHAALSMIAGQRFPMRISQTHMERAFQPLFNEAWAMLLQAAREAQIALSYQSLTRQRLASMSEDQLLRDIDFIVLAGGMAHLHVFKRMLIENLAKVGSNLQRSIQIVGGESDFPGYTVDTAVSLGLAMGQELERINYHRPQFSLFLEVEDRDGNRVELAEPVYRAFASLQQFKFNVIEAKPLVHEWRFADHVPEQFHGARAWLVAKDIDGMRRPFREVPAFPTQLKSQSPEELESEIAFEIRPRNYTNWSNDFIGIQSSGRIVIHSGVTKLEIAIPRWPADRREPAVLYVKQDPRLNFVGNETRSALRPTKA